jgi:hypothetical protein
MKRSLTAILCLAAATTASAAETQNKFAGCWVGIAEFGTSKNPDLKHERALLTIEVDPQGVITNGAIRDFAGHALAGFWGQLDSRGRISTSTFPLQGSTSGQLEIDLGRTSGVGTYRALIFDTWHFRSSIRFWREKKPTRDGEGSGDISNGTMGGSMTVALTPASSHLVTVPPPTNVPPANPNP